jgi:hypothetical protein
MCKVVLDLLLSEECKSAAEMILINGHTETQSLIFLAKGSRFAKWVERSDGLFNELKEHFLLIHDLNFQSLYFVG